MLGDKAKSNCHNGVCTTSDGMNAGNNGVTSANVANAMLPIGVVLAGGGIAALVLAAKASTPAPKEGRWHLVPVVGPGLALVSVNGRM